MNVKGFSLIEIVVVMSLIALTLTLVGPRIGAGIGRLELDEAEQAIRGFVKSAGVQAERSDRAYYVVIDRKKKSMTLLDPEMKSLRTKELPSSVEVSLESDSDFTTISVAPSGIVRSGLIRLRGRSGDLKVNLQ
jgi:prepilin-type N-terminal cleavage/methylation domain-containing protein